MRRPAQALVALALLPLTHACKKPPPLPPEPLARVAASSGAVLFGPSVHGAMQSVNALLTRMEKQDAKGASRQDLITRLGFDPTTLEGLAAAGLQPGGPFAGGIDDDGATWILPVADNARALETVDRLSKQAEGADKVSELKVGDVGFKQYARPFGSREAPVFCVASVPTQLVVTTGKLCKERMTTALTLVPAQSMSQDARLTAVRPQLPGTPIQFFINTAQAEKLDPTGKLAGKLIQHVAGGLQLGLTGIQLHAWAAFNPARKDDVLKGLFPSGEGLPLPGLLEPDVLVAGQGTLAWKAATQVATNVDPSAIPLLQKRAAQLGLEIEESVLALTDGHYAGALYTLDGAAWAALLREGVDLRHQLLRVVPFVFLMRPAAGQTTAIVVDKLVERLNARGMKVASADGITTATPPGGSEWRRWYLAVVGNTVLVGGGARTRFDAALKRLQAAGKDAPSAELAGLSKGNVSTLVIRLDQAGARADEVLKQNLGDGAEALMLHNMIQKARTQFGLLKTVTVTLQPAPEGARFDLDLALGAAVP